MNLLTPGIRAEVNLILSEQGQIGIFHSKLQPEDDASQVYGMLLMRWLAVLSGLGVTLNFQTEDMQIIPLVRPATTASAAVRPSH